MHFHSWNQGQALVKWGGQARFLDSSRYFWTVLDIPTGKGYANAPPLLDILVSCFGLL